jgi:protein-disulfide isomerase
MHCGENRQFGTRLTRIRNKRIIIPMRLWLAGASLIAFLQSGTVIGAEFTPEQRKEIVEIVREALKSDPSILREGVEALQSTETERQAVAARAAIEANRDALYSRPDPIGGAAKADVTIIEFLDPRCPYCRQVAPALAMLRRNDPGIRIIYKDMAVLGPPSVLASRALLAADRQGGYEKLLTAVMSGPPTITEDSLRGQAQQLGFDWPRMQKDMADPENERRFEANRQLAKTLGIEGTPGFVIGDRIIAGSDIAEVQGAIAAVRAQRKSGAGAATAGQ